MRIVAIGGGDLLRETRRIDERVVSLARCRRPRALFVPTASGDPAAYCATFERVYGSELGCRTDTLRLLAEPGDRRAARRKIEAADLIYVGGGNTLRMMKLWRRLGVDRLLVRAARSTVLAGLSAGAICWCAAGLSDSRKFTGKDDWSYIRVRGLGLLPHLYCPHLDAEQRQAPLAALVAKRRETAIACDNRAAVFFDGKGLTCWTSHRGARAWVYEPTDGEVRVTAFRDGASLEP